MPLKRLKIPSKVSKGLIIMVDILTTLYVGVEQIMMASLEIMTIPEEVTIFSEDTQEMG